MNKSEMKQILVDAELRYGHKEFTEPEVMAWLTFFKDEEEACFRTAFNAAYTEKESMPTPGEIQEKIDIQICPYLPSMTMGEVRKELAACHRILIDEAMEWADKLVPAIDGELKNTETLDRILLTRKARWDREFYHYLGDLEAQVRESVRLGIEPKNATLWTQSNASILLKSIVGSLYSTMGKSQKIN